MWKTSYFAQLNVFMHTRVASNSAAYKLGMLLQDVLKRGMWSNAITFFTYYFREIEDSLDLDEQHDT